MTAWPLVLFSLLAAGLNAWALYTQRMRWVFFTKPAVMLFLLAFFFLEKSPAPALTWFGLGLVLALIGDVLLLWPDRLFVFALLSFLLAQIAYIVAFNIPIPDLNAFGLGLAVMYGLMAARIFPHLEAGLRKSGQIRLRIPVLIYSIVITLMLLSASLPLFRHDWATLPAVLVFLGAALFFLSDLLLAWLRFVRPVRNGRMLNMLAYHLGQILLTLGMLARFGGS